MSKLIILFLAVPDEIFDMVCIQQPPNTTDGNIALDIDATTDANAAFAAGAIISQAMNTITKNNIENAKERG